MPVPEPVGRCGRFRWDYQELLPLGHTGSLHMLEEEGVRAERVYPIFPSVSYASWTSIVTGEKLRTPTRPP